MLELQYHDFVVHATYIGVLASTSIRYYVAGGHPRREVHNLSDNVTSEAYSLKQSNTCFNVQLQ